MYIPIHLHTHYSMLDGVATPEEYVARAQDVGMHALAITDHGTLSGHRKMYFACKDAEIKPILGVEAYICPDRFDKRDKSERTTPLDLIYNHIILLAKDQTGLQNLGIMNEIAWTEGFYRKPRIDIEILEKYREGIIVSSACLSGLVAKAIEVGDLAEAKRWVTWFKDRFEDDFYIEVMPHNPPAINKTLLELADHFGIKPVVSPDCHHATPDQRVIQEMMLLINTHAKLREGVTYESSVKFKDMMERFDYLYGADRQMTFKDFKIHLLSPAEMEAEMTEQGITRQDIYTNTSEVAAKVSDYNLTKNVQVELPVTFDDPMRELRQISTDGLKRLGHTGKEYKDRLDYELGIIDQKGLAPYFLIVADMISWATGQGIRMGPGRGSAAGSLVCYAMGITQVDPLKYGLLFERFISLDRMDPPDIDTDAMHTRRDEIKQYLADKYHNVASVATFIEYSEKNMVKDIARILNIPYEVVEKVSKHFNTWDDFLSSPKTQEFRNKYPEVEQYCLQMRGRFKSTGAHAAGVVLSNRPLREFAPIETRAGKGGERLVVVGIDGEEAAETGLIKIDNLGLINLTVIEDCVSIIKERHGIKIDFRSMPLDDPKVYQMLSDGNTLGVFQCEAGPYTNLILKMGIRNFNELAASNALIRPGAFNTIGNLYLNRKFGKDKTTYANKELNRITKDTYGCVLYQEQVMQICQHLGGMTGAEANKVRSIIGKKKDVKEFDAYKEKFIQNATGPLGKALAEELWHDFEAHAGYSFNKSHAVAYSLLSYQTAWLKANYPLEFMYALLKNEEDSDVRTQYLIEAKRMGVQVKLPHINLSDADFKIDGEGLIMGLTSIKFISDNIAGKYIAGRPFDSYKAVEDFTFTKGNGVNSRALAALKAVGALTFPDNPRDEEAIKGSLFEYLNLPEFDMDLPKWFDAYFTDIIDYEKGQTCLIRAIAKKITRKNGWLRVDFMDKTGMVGFFDNPDTAIVKGKIYILLVANNRIVDAVPLESVKDETIPLIRFLNYRDPIDQGKYFVLSFKPRTTKAGKRMGSLMLANGDREIKEVTVFPKLFNEAYMYCEPGSLQELKFQKLEDSTICLGAICRN